MERQKSILGRKKGRGPAAPPGDFIALGKQSKPSESDGKRPGSPQAITRKKDSPGTALSSASAAKKPKLGGSLYASLGKAHGDGTGASFSGAGLHVHDDIAVTVDPAEFLHTVLSAEDDQNDEKVEALLCGAAKSLRGTRAKPDSVLYLSLMHLTKARANLFSSDAVIEAFCSLLKRDIAISFKAKGNPLVSVLSCNLLMNAFSEEENWPDSFVKVFVEDSLGERVWVDRDDCRTFVDNIMTAFGTKKSPKHLLMATADAVRVDTPGSSSPVPMVTDDDDNSKMSDDGDKGGSGSSPLFPRYPFQQNVVESYILDTTRDILNRRQSMDSSSRNLIRLMTSTCGYSEIRNMAAQRIDMWLQNPKLTRVSQDLLLAVCTNCDQHDQSDLEVIAHLTKMRMKTKPLINHFLNCMRELLSQHPENLRMILNHTVYNELSQSRNPNNMPLVTGVFSHSPDQAAKILAEIFQDLLVNKDDYVKALRILLREIVRCTRLDMNFSTFCLGLMQERTETKFADMEPILKERYVMSLADLISMDILLSIAPSIREAAAGFMQGDPKNLELIHVFKRQVGVIQRDAVWWLHMVVPKMVELKPEAYLHCLKKVLFLETADHYYNKDNWPPESERGLMLKLASESPVMEDTLMRLLVIGLLPDLPLSAPDAVELVDQLVCRAASLTQDLGMVDVLQMEQLGFIDTLLKLCVYKHPDSIQLPAGYTPPNLAITGLMWKAWLTLLVITAYNPSVFGETAWQKFPGLQSLMEMVMTNNYTFPPPTSVTDEKMAEELRARERQIRQQEIQLILEFETHLAAATSKMTITESSSLLIGQLNHNDPQGPARFPPPEIIEQLKSLNGSLRLGQMLCRSRGPDFLLHIINRQGTSKSMPWLAELVESSEGSLDVLPVQCLCEFLLHEPSDLATDADVEDIFGADRSKRKQKNKKHQQLLSRLQELVHSSSTDSGTMKEVLDYFLQRLSSTQAATRQQAVKGLSLVVAPDSGSSGSDGDEFADVDMKTPETEEWLLQHVPSLPLFQGIIEALCSALLQACQVETDPDRVRSYVLFLAQYGIDTPQPTLNELVQVIAQLLVERASVANHILPDIGTLPKEKTNVERAAQEAFAKIFVAFMRIARNEDEDDTFSWSNTQDQIRLQWESGQSATMHVLVVRAMIILLSYGKPSDDRNKGSNPFFDELFNMWVQENNRMPYGYLVDTSEEALLLPDWLKLRMLRSTDKRIVDAALQEVEPTQLVTLIQWFGIPVSSMSRLLDALDQAVADDPALMSQLVSDAGYMANLIDIQHERGASGGQRFYRLLKQGKEEEGKTTADNSETEMEVASEDMWSAKGTGDVILPNSVDKMARLLDQIFTNNGGSDKGAASLFQSALQAVSTDKAKAAVVVKAFDNLLSSSKREAFAEKVYATTCRSCPILKILIAKQTDLHPEITHMVEKLHSLGSGQRSMLTSVVTQFLLTRSKQSKQIKQMSSSLSASATAKQVETLVNKTSSAKKGLDTDGFLQGLKRLKDPESMELAVRRMMDGLLAQGRTKEGTKLACQALAQDGSGMHEGAATLFIDWMSLLDPEIVQSNPALEQKLLFARAVTDRKDGGSTGGAGRKGASVSSQAHLLALLTHQASWSTLVQCVTHLLQPTKTQQLDPSAVLDFLWACEHIPKIWQGREKSTQKIEYKEDVLKLTASQLTVVVDLIVEEMLLSGQCASPTDSGDNELKAITSGRLDLLLHCVCEDVERVIGVVDHLQGVYNNVSGLKRQCVESVAASLYLQFPYIQAWLVEDSPLLSQVMASSAVQSQMDVISHRLITGLGMIGHGNKAQGRMADANMSCRKMAAHHPDIFLRQLSLLGSVLAGQTQFTIGQMRHTGRLQLFTHVLGLIELLQPHVFARQHSNSFTTLLDAFFCLMKFHGEEKALGAQVHKFVLILQNFLSCDSYSALPVLQKQLPLLSNLSLVYPDMLEIKALITNVTLPRQGSESTGRPATATGGPSSSSRKAGVGGAGGSHRQTVASELLSPGPSFSTAQLAQFRRRLRSNFSEDLSLALRDLDEMSKRKIEILPHFEDELKSLMMAPSDSCRNTAFNLVIRLLKHNPRKAENFVTTFLDCLGSDDQDVVTSALKSLADFTALCQEEATVLLQKAFTVGIKLSMDSSTYISEALHTLNLQSTVS